MMEGEWMGTKRRTMMDVPGIDRRRKKRLKKDPENDTKTMYFAMF